MQPPVKAHQGPSQIAANMAGIRTDEEFDLYMTEQKQGGSTVCSVYDNVLATSSRASAPHKSRQGLHAQVPTWV